MVKTQGELINILNAEGYLFQLGIEHEITSQPNLPFHVEMREKRWVDSTSNKEHFIDIVLEDAYGVFQLIVECKRVHPSTWVFLLDEKYPETQIVRALWAQFDRGEKPLSGWDDLWSVNKYYQSGFCVVQKKQADGETLEHIAGTVVKAAENVADEQIRLMQNAGYRLKTVFLPVIVTNATLAVHRYAASEIQKEDGKLPIPVDAGAPIVQAPFVLFRKTFATKIEPYRYQTIRDAHLETERNVFIVNSLHLTDFLKELRLEFFEPMPGGKRPPWVTARALQPKAGSSWI